MPSKTGYGIHNVHGLSKGLLEARVVSSLLRALVRRRGELSLPLRELPGYSKDLFGIASGPTAIKYVKFKGKVFLDGYTPPWPTEGFFRTVVAAPAYLRSPAPGEVATCFYAVVSLTKRCMYRCAHCYTAHMLDSHDTVPDDVLLKTIAQMLDLGVGILSLEGGEPLLRFDTLTAILDLAKGRTNPYIATTGFGLTEDKAKLLAEKGLVAAQISLDSVDPEVHNKFRKSPKAFDSAVSAVSRFREAGVFPILSMVAAPSIVEDGGLYRYLEFAREIGAGMIQILDPLPTGNNGPDQEGHIQLTPEQRQAVYDFHVEVNTDPRWKDHPSISARLYVEGEESVGCGWGGMGIYYIDSSGNLEPCPFTNISVGNILEEDFLVLHKRMRSLFGRPVGGLCPAYEVGNEEAKARAVETPLPLKLQQTREIAARITQRPLPRLLQRIAGRKRTQEGC